MSAARQRPPGPPLSAIPGLLRKLVVDRLGMMEAAASYGDATRMFLGPKTLYVFNDPASAKHVLADNAANYHKGIGLVQARRALGNGLLTSEDELWRTQRRVIQPAFQAKRIAAQAGIVAGEAARLVERLRERAGAGPVDVLAEMTGLTLGVLGAGLLAADLSRFESVGDAFETVQDLAMFDMVTLGAVPLWLPSPGHLRFRRSRRYLTKVVDRLVTDRRGEPVAPGDDALSRLVVSVAGRTDHSTVRKQLRDELVTLLLAGYETTASTLGWTFHLLGAHPEVAQRVRAEVCDVLGDRPPEYDDLRSLTYTTMVVQEVMRLYPPVWILPRIAQGPDTIAGYPVPARADVLICPYTMHRHPGLWPDPLRFDPDRFGPEQSADRPRYAYIPFGGGPRFCVGSNLGMMEAIFVIAMVVRELRLAPVPGHQAVPEPMLSLRVRDGLPMTVHHASAAVR